MQQALHLQHLQQGQRAPLAQGQSQQGQQAPQAQPQQGQQAPHPPAVQWAAEGAANARTNKRKREQQGQQAQPPPQQQGQQAQQAPVQPRYDGRTNKHKLQATAQALELRAITSWFSPAGAGGGGQP